MTDAYMRWWKGLKDHVAKQRINARLRTIAIEGRLVGDFKAVGSGVVELRFFVGPGYRVYCTVEGSRLLLLLVGGDKSSQTRDIEIAQRLAREWRKQ